MSKPIEMKKKSERGRRSRMKMRVLLTRWILFTFIYKYAATEKKQAEYYKGWFSYGSDISTKNKPYGNIKKIIYYIGECDMHRRF